MLIRFVPFYFNIFLYVFSMIFNILVLILIQAIACFGHYYRVLSFFIKIIIIIVMLLNVMANE
jgi:hypothetical protein